MNFAASFVLLLTLDQVSKSCASEITYNSAFFLGSLTWASSFYRIFCTLALMALGIVIISLLQFLTWRNFPILSWALTLLEAGMVGNGIDKLRFGAVRDFIPFSLFQSTIVLNFADLFQIIGIVAILALIWIHPQRLWPKDNLRTQLLVYPRSQLRMTFVLILITTLVSIGSFILITAYLKSNQIGFDLREAAICFTCFLLLTCSIVFIFGIVWSNRIYGPFRVIERYLKNSDSKIRASDEHECVREILTLLKTKNSGKDEDPT